MPSLSPTMEEGTLTSWKVQEGDEVNQGDTLAEVQTDKATMEMEAMEEGYVAKILVPAGSESIPVGKPVAVIAERKEDVQAFQNYSQESFDQPEQCVPSPLQLCLAKSFSHTLPSVVGRGKEEPTPAEEPVRTVTERPDYRPIDEQVKEGKPTRASRAPTDPEAGSTHGALPGLGKETFLFAFPRFLLPLLLEG